MPCLANLTSSNRTYQEDCPECLAMAGRHQDTKRGRPLMIADEWVNEEQRMGQVYSHDGDGFADSWKHGRRETLCGLCHDCSVYGGEYPVLPQDPDRGQMQRFIM